MTTAVNGPMASCRLVANISSITDTIVRVRETSEEAFGEGEGRGGGGGGEII